MRRTRVGVTAAVLVALAACGGGGGGNDDGNDDPTSSVAEDEIINPSNSNPSANRAPIADAGDLIQVNKGALIQLDGSKSRDPDGDEIFYEWTIIRQPDKAKPLTGDASTAMPYMVQTPPGEYVVQLVVTDDIDSSEPSTVTVLVEDAGPAPVRPPVDAEVNAMYEFALTHVKKKLAVPSSFSLIDNVRYGQNDSAPETGALGFKFSVKNKFGATVSLAALCPIVWLPSWGNWSNDFTDDFEVCDIGL